MVGRLRAIARQPRLDLPRQSLPQPAAWAYTAKLTAAGFGNVAVETTRTYSVEDAREFLTSAGIDVSAIAPHVDGKFRSAFIRAVKPRPRSGCCS